MRHLSEGSKERAAIKFKKERLRKSLSEEDSYDVTDEDSDNEIEGGLEKIERRQLKQVIKENREMLGDRQVIQEILVAVVRSL